MSALRIRDVWKRYGLLPVLTAYVLSIFLNWTVESKNREIYMLNVELEQRRRLAGSWSAAS